METNKILEQTREATQQLGESAQEWAQKAKGKARNAGAAADLYLHEYAWTTVVVVAVTAAFIGYALGKRGH